MPKKRAPAKQPKRKPSARKPPKMAASAAPPKKAKPAAKRPKPAAKKAAAKKPKPAAKKPKPAAKKPGAFARLAAGVGSLLSRMTGRAPEAASAPEPTIEITTRDILMERDTGGSGTT